MLPTWSEIQPTSNVECESPNTCETNSSKVTLLARRAGETTFCETAVKGPEWRYRAITVIRKAGTKTRHGPVFGRGEGGDRDEDRADEEAGDPTLGGGSRARLGAAIRDPAAG